MRRTIAAGMTVVMLFSGCRTASRSGPSVVGKRVDSLAIARTVLDYVEATRQQNVTGELASFTDDATFITTNGRYIAGKRQLEAFYAGLVGTTDSIHYRNGSPVVRMLDAHNAVVYYTWEVDWYRSRGNSNLNDIGMMTISVQQRDGKWQWVALTSQRMPEFFDMITERR